MTIRFATKVLENWFTGDYSGRQPFSEAVLKAYRKTVNKLSVANATAELRQNKSLDFHPLKRDLAGKYAVRVNMQYRVVFALTNEGGFEIIEVEQLTDYH